MVNETTRQVKIAAVQMASQVGQIEANLGNAETWVQKCAAQGTQLVLLPELMPSGYTLSARLWESAEPANGPTAHWLCAMGKKYGIYIGTSFVEADGEHFYNTFILANPDGFEVGRVRKEHAETYLFKSASRVNHVIKTELGLVGVGICADNHYAFLLPQLQEASVDLLLMPHAWPAPFKTGPGVSEEDIQRQQRMAREIAPYYTRWLGVPSVFANHCGSVCQEKGVGITASALSGSNYHFAGLSRIIDSNGSLVGSLEGEEGLILAQVTLDPALKRKETAPVYGKWIMPKPFAVDALLTVDGAAGRLWYALNRKRKSSALRLQ